MKKETLKAICSGFIATLLLGFLILAGSRHLAHFDPALVGYTFSILFTSFAITYRYVIWLQRPPTAIYWRRGWQLAFQPKRILKNILFLSQRMIQIFALNHFIWKRDIKRGAAHWLIMWGCIIAALVTFPLVFGWLYFESDPQILNDYRIIIFGFPTVSFPVGSGLASIIFHALVIASFFVIVGVMLAMRRRMRDRDAAILQTFGEDFLPLILLFAISLTGLMLTVSYTWLAGYGYDFLSTFHAITVIFNLIWLPFGKFFHIFQRPAQLGVGFYKNIAVDGPPATCFRCQEVYSSKMQVDDLIEIEERLEYRYELPHHKALHYQRFCPRCRRIVLGIAQGKTWNLI